MSLSFYGNKLSSKTRGNRSKTYKDTKDAKSFETLEYPLDLGVGRYPHYVIFYINSNEKAQVAQGGKDATYDLDLTKRANQGIGSQVHSRRIGNEGQSDRIPQSNGSAPNSNEEPSMISSTLSALGDMAASFVASRVRRLKHAIVLHTPHQVRSSYNANYEEFTNGGIAGSALHGWLSGQKFGDIASSAAQGVLKEGVRIAAGSVGTVIGMEGAMSAIEKARGESENPRAETLFKSIGFREFEFNYIFAPKTEEDSKLIKDIIYLFKYHMHPEISKLTTTGQYLVMPSEFDIEYYYKNEENLEVNRITTCVLTSMNVDYTPNNTWQAFSGTGSPTHITMALRFKETEPLNRNLIDGGF